MSKIVHNMQHAYRRKRYQWQFTLGGLTLAALIWGGLYLTDTLPSYIAWLSALSLVAFIFFGWDKAKAKARSDVRIPEITLHLFSLFGGFVGGFLGMQIWRHKTDWSEHFVFPMVMLVGLVVHGGLLWLFYFS